MEENEHDQRLHHLRQSYKELQDSASNALSRALNESSKVYQSVLVDLNEPRKRATEHALPQPKTHTRTKQPSIMDEFISEPSVPLRTPAIDEFLDLITCLMEEPERPKSPQFGRTNHVLR